MANLAGVAAGGLLGVLARYGVMLASGDRDGSGFPFAILAVNLTGSFAIGLLAGAFMDRPEIPAWLRLGVTVGFLGGYTTFSTLSLDIVRLATGGRLGLAAIDALVSLVGGVAAAAAGLYAARQL